MKSSELIQLVRNVFAVEPGRTLFKELEQQLSGPLYDESPYKVYWRAGQQDLLREWKNFIEMPANVLASIIEAENEAETMNKFLDSGE